MRASRIRAILAVLGALSLGVGCGGEEESAAEPATEAAPSDPAEPSAAEPSAAAPALPACPDRAERNEDIHFCLTIPATAELDSAGDDYRSYVIDGGPLAEVRYAAGEDYADVGVTDGELLLAGQAFPESGIEETRAIANGQGTFWRVRECESEDSCIFMGVAAVRAPGGVTSCIVEGDDAPAVELCSTLLPH